MFRSSEKSLAGDGREQREKTGRVDNHSLQIGVREARVETRSFPRSPMDFAPKRDRISTFSPFSPMARFSRRSVRK
jgi:hypothetical protein